MQSGERRSTRAAVAYDDSCDRLAEGRFECSLPAGVDVHEIEQRSDDAVEPGEALCPGACSGLVERRAERLDPGLPGSPFSFRGPQIVLAGPHTTLGEDELSIGGVPSRSGRRRGPHRRDGVTFADIGDQRLDLDLQFRRLAPQTLHPFGDRRGPCVKSHYVGTSPFGGLAVGAQLGAQLGRTRTAPVAVCGIVSTPCGEEHVTFLGQRVLLIGEIEEQRWQVVGLVLDSLELGDEARRFGRERLDNALVDERVPITLDPSAPLAEERQLPASLFVQCLGSRQHVAEVHSGERVVGDHRRRGAAHC